MAIRRTLLTSSAGVKLTLVETVERDRVIDAHFRVTTFRTVQPRVYADRVLAEEAFAREVTASKNDPVAVAVAAGLDEATNAMALHMQKTPPPK